MNQNKKVLELVWLITLSLLALSIITYHNKFQNSQLDNISILSSVVSKDSALKNSISTKQPIEQIRITDTLEGLLIENIFFNKPHRITTFSNDTNAIVLENFIKKLIQLKQTKKGKVRIAYFGDSMIEGDFISQTLRKYLQQNFGGNGVGFVPITSAVAGFRTSVKHSFTSNWKEENVKNSSTKNLFLSGKIFYANGYNRVEFEDNTITQYNNLNKFLLTGFKNTPSQIVVNGSFKSMNTPNFFNKILLDNTLNKKIKIEASDKSIPFYGVSFETNDGVIVDNFSFRGIAGYELSIIDTNILNTIEKNQPYDLIILQYGTNLFNNANNKDFGWYEIAMINYIKKLQKHFSNANFLLVGSADKSFKYNNGVHSAIGMDSLIEKQQNIARKTNIAYYNTYASMGGYNSLVDWANAKPAKAAKDYTHLNALGAETIGTSIFNAIIYEVKKTENRN